MESILDRIAGDSEDVERADWQEQLAAFYNKLTRWMDASHDYASPAQVHATLKTMLDLPSYYGIWDVLLYKDVGDFYVSVAF